MVLVVAPEGDDEVTLWVNNPRVNGEILYGGLHVVERNSKKNQRKPIKSCEKQIFLVYLLLINNI